MVELVGVVVVVDDVVASDVVLVVLVVTGRSSGQTHGGLEHVHGASIPVHLSGFLFLQ